MLLYCNILFYAKVIATAFIMLQDLRPIPPPEKTKEEILLFFKLYNPEKKELRY